MLDPDELQLLFEVHTGKYVSIFEFERNVQPLDSISYFDKNMGTTKEFQTISNKRTSKFNVQPWENFWLKKDRANYNLIEACKNGQIEKVAKLLNPL